MDENAIVEAIEIVQAALAADANFANVYDHIPSKPNFPCVVIAPGVDLIDDADTFSRRQVNIDIWIIAEPSSDNRSVQHSLYKDVARAITLLESVDDIEFDKASRPLPTTYNQTKTLASILEANILI